MKPIRIGRWTFEVYQRAIHVTRGPDLQCPDCSGHGGIETGGQYVLDYHWSPEFDLCGCWDPAPLVRLQLWPRRTERVPF